MSDLTGCKKESADMNNIIEEQILKPCKTIKTENFFKCDEEYSLSNMRLHTEDGLQSLDAKQILHLKGLSPVCVLICVSKVAF
jgi:hypothetical protein